MTLRVLATGIMVAAALLICLILPFAKPGLTPMLLLQEYWMYYVAVIGLLTAAVCIIEAKS